MDDQAVCAARRFAQPDIGDAQDNPGFPRVHFIGIGGIGMSGIARLLVRYGYAVSGSDSKESAITRELSQAGARVHIGHAAAHLGTADIVVYSSAIREDNPEMQEALRRGVSLMQRARLLALLMENKRGITVAGSHGKTTTTSLCSHLLMLAGMSPTAAIGGILRNVGSNTCVGTGCFFVAEADESDGSFLYYRPEYSLITNIDREHLDYYRTFENQVDAFRQFIANTRPNGCIIACADDGLLRDLVSGFGGRRVLYGLGAGADVTARDLSFEGLSASFDCYHAGSRLGRFSLSLGGRHNVANALSVVALGRELGIPVPCIAEALRTYQGAGRRLEIKIVHRGITLIDDYAHHPTEIRATLQALSGLRAQRLLVAFQPHRYSRTQMLLADFAESFDGVDHLVVTDIYAASEAPRAGVSALALIDELRVRRPGADAVYKRTCELAEYLVEILRPGDVLVTMGAGDIVAVGEEIARRIQT